MQQINKEKLIKTLTDGINTLNNTNTEDIITEINKILFDDSNSLNIKTGQGTDQEKLIELINTKKEQLEEYKLKNAIEVFKNSDTNTIQQTRKLGITNIEAGINPEQIKITNIEAGNIGHEQIKITNIQTNIGPEPIKINNIESGMNKSRQGGDKLKALRVTNTQPDNDKLLNQAILEDVVIGTIPYNKREEEMEYIVVESTPIEYVMINGIIKKSYRVETTDAYFCFMDIKKKESYENKVREIREQLENEKQKYQNGGSEKEYKKSCNECASDLKALNKEIIEDYKSEGTSAFAGMKIIRKDSLGRTTSLVNSTSVVQVVTKGLNENNAIRLRLSSGCYLNLNLDKDGNVDENQKPIFLTSIGASQEKMFTGKEHDPYIIYNNYATIKKDLKQLRSISVNGHNVKGFVADFLNQLTIKNQDKRFMSQPEYKDSTFVDQVSNNNKTKNQSQVLP